MSEPKLPASRRTIVLVGAVAIAVVATLVAVTIAMLIIRHSLAIGFVRP
jgi:hypothetical protein